MQVGDRVKLILDKERSLDNRWHGRTGEIIKVHVDDVGAVTGSPTDNFSAKVRLDDGAVPDVWFRYRDLVLLEEHEAALGTKWSD